MMMKHIALAAIAGLALGGCQADDPDNQEFFSMKLSVDLEETDSTFELSGYRGNSDAYVTKAALWCNGAQRQVFNFTEYDQTADLFGAIENCEMHLMEFRLGEHTFQMGNQYATSISEFQARNAKNRLVDNRLVRSQQRIGQGQLIDDCKKDCQFKKVRVVFPYSVLDIRNEILENTVVYTQLQVGMEEEPAPQCDYFSAEFVNGKDFLTPPSLVIHLSNCHNTIGTKRLEFGLDKTYLSEAGQFTSQFLITDAQRVINNLPAQTVRNGNDYTITLSLEDIKALWGKDHPTTVDALTTDFVVAVRNKKGISALVYAVQNKCVIKHDDGKDKGGKGKKRRW